MPNFAVVSAARRSQEAAISSPAPRQYPERRGDHRHRRVSDRGACVVQRGDERPGRLRREIDHGSDVRPADERPVARSAQHDDPHVTALTRPSDGGGQRFGTLAVDDVELVRVVMADGRYASATGIVLEINMNSAHRFFPVSQPVIVWLVGAVLPGSAAGRNEAFVTNFE